MLRWAIRASEWNPQTVCSTAPVCSANISTRLVLESVSPAVPPSTLQQCPSYCVQSCWTSCLNVTVTGACGPSSDHQQTCIKQHRTRGRRQRMVWTCSMRWVAGNAAYSVITYAAAGLLEQLLFLVINLGTLGSAQLLPALSPQMSRHQQLSAQTLMSSSNVGTKRGYFLTVKYCPSLLVRHLQATPVANWLRKRPGC